MKRILMTTASCLLIAVPAMAGTSTGTMHAPSSGDIELQLGSRQGEERQPATVYAPLGTGSGGSAGTSGTGTSGTGTPDTPQTGTTVEPADSEGISGGTDASRNSLGATGARQSGFGNDVTTRGSDPVPGAEPGVSGEADGSRNSLGTMGERQSGSGTSASPAGSNSPGTVSE